jgi:hypothetical protein
VLEGVKKEEGRKRRRRLTAAGRRHRVVYTTLFVESVFKASREVRHEHVIQVTVRKRDKGWRNV